MRKFLINVLLAACASGLFAESPSMDEWRSRANHGNAERLIEARDLLRLWQGVPQDPSRLPSGNRKAALQGTRLPKPTLASSTRMATVSRRTLPRR